MAAKKKTRKVQTKASARKAAGAKAGKPAAKKTGRRSKPARRRTSAAPEDRVAEIQRVIDVMVAAGAVEVELEEAGSKLRVRLKEDPQVVSYTTAHPAAALSPPVGSVPGVAPSAEAPAAPVEDPRRHVFTSPMVGTFYRASSPDAEPFAEVGDHVSPDSTICILEAMKVMNEIKAELSGEILEVLAQNGEPVEYGQPLFVVLVD